jgi:hypothetical protein
VGVVLPQLAVVFAAVVLVGADASAAKAGDGRVAAQSTALLRATWPCGKAQDVMGRSSLATSAQRQAFIARLITTESLCKAAGRRLTTALAAGKYDTVKGPASTVLAALHAAVASDAGTLRALTQIAQGKKALGLRTLATAEQEGRRFVDLWNSFIRKLRAARVAAGLSPV